jgi:hypothetical protein
MKTQWHCPECGSTDDEDLSGGDLSLCCDRLIVSECDPATCQHLASNA